MGLNKENPMTTRWAWVWLVLAASTLASDPAAAAPVTRVERAGTVGLGAFGSYGTVVGDSRFGLQFQNGGGYGVDLRYVAGPHWSLGLTFQNQMYQPEDSGGTQDKLVTTGLLFNVYYYRKRGLDVANYLVLGAGFYRPEIHFLEVVDDENRESISFPGESLALTGGMGVELFIRENWGFNISGRAIAYFGDGVAQEEELDPDSPAESNGNISVGLLGQVGLFYYLIK